MKAKVISEKWPAIGDSRYIVVTTQLKSPIYIKHGLGICYILVAD